MLVVLGSSAGGVARHVGQVAAVLEADGRPVRAAGPSAVRELVAPAPLDVVEITDRPHPRADLRAVRALRRLGRGADVVHAHGLRAGALTVLALRGVRRAPTTTTRSPRVVVTLHNLPVGGRAIRTVSAVLERVVARGADAVLGVSPDLVERARALGARGVALALVPAPHAVPATEPAAAAGSAATAAATRRALGLTRDERLVVTVGRLAPQKGTDVLADAAARLARSAAGWRWAVAGDGPLRDDLAARVAASGAPVTLLGARDDVPDLLAAADVVVSAARWEGQPLWLQEALAAGAPVVATDAGGTASVVGDAALLTPVGDPAALAEAVASLLADDDARADLRRRALERAAALPTSTDLAAQLDAVYRPTPGSTP